MRLRGVSGIQAPAGIVNERRVHSMSVLEVPNGVAVDYVAICSCGWEALPWTERELAATDRCEVLVAEVDGAKRRARRLKVAA
jgi:hypothetical protein